MQSVAIKKEALKLTWYMRGGVSYEAVMDMSHSERASIVEIVKDNLEITKTSKMPFF